MRLLAFPVDLAIGEKSLSKPIAIKANEAHIRDVVHSGIQQTARDL